ncbi:MAG: hypothetical protein WA830_11170 [Candidatus Sulfotelmatobacter sp.]
MSISKAIFSAVVFFAPVFFCAAQPTAGSTPAAPAATTATSIFTPSAPSAILQRALDEVEQTVGAVKLDKWKRGTVREEADKNIGAIQRDLQGTLPSLLKAADAAPGTLSKVLPLARNIDALYDVMVHVVEASRVSAPGDQVGQLQQAMADLEKARVALGEQMQQTATMQEKQLVDLHATVQTQAASLRAASTPQPAPKCPAPPPAPAKKKHTTTPSTASKPASATTTPSTASKPAAGTPANQPPKTQ